MPPHPLLLPLPLSPFSPAARPFPGESKRLVMEGPGLGATQPVPSAAEMSDAREALPRLQGFVSRTWYRCSAPLRLVCHAELGDQNPLVLA